MDLSKHFDKLLLTFLILVFAGTAFRGYHVGSVGLENFGSDTTKLFAGALLTLITGSVLKKNGAPPLDAAPPEPPPASLPSSSPPVVSGSGGSGGSGGSIGGSGGSGGGGGVGR